MASQTVPERPQNSANDLVTYSGAVAPESLVEALSEASEFWEAAVAPATRRAYDSDFADFTDWCSDHGLESLPAEPETVAGYVSGLAKRRRLKASTINRRLAAIRFHHHEAGLASPTDHPGVRRVNSGIRRSIGTRSSASKPLLWADLQTAIALMPESTARRRDSALLLVGFLGALRRSELVALDLEDVEFVEQGILLTVRSSKTDQEQHGRMIAIPNSRDDPTSATQALQRWLTEAQIESGPLFRSFTRSGRPRATRLTPQSVALIVKRAAKLAGLNPASYSGHSLRSGFATSAALAGAEERTIAEQTGHQSMATLRGYIRKGNIWRDNAAITLLH